MKKDRIIIKAVQKVFREISKSAASNYAKKGIISVNTLTREVTIEKRDELNKRILANYPKLKNISISDINYIETLYEDNDLIAIAKQGGIATHFEVGSSLNAKDILHKQIILKSKNPFVNPQPINRIDKDTEGIVLFSKNTETHTYYSKLFKRREVKKEYICLSENLNNQAKIEQHFTIQNYISKFPINRKYFLTTEEKGDLAETSFTILKRLLGKNTESLLIQANLHTGRTHQIRVQLSEIGLPIIGDNIYNSNKSNEKMYLACTGISLKKYITSENLVITYAPKGYPSL